MPAAALGRHQPSRARPPRRNAGPVEQGTANVLHGSCRLPRLGGV